MRTAAERMDDLIYFLNAFAIIIQLLFLIFIIFLILSFLERKGYLKKIKNIFKKSTKNIQKLEIIEEPEKIIIKKNKKKIFIKNL